MQWNQKKMNLVSGDGQAAKFWENRSFQQLLQQSRGSRRRNQRMELSKQIRNISGNACGKDMYLRTERILAGFVQLNRLDEVQKTHTKNQVSKNNRHHRCLRSTCRTYSRWKFPHQIYNLVSRMVMKVPMFRGSRLVSLTMC